ncbi:hypothetical protein OG863_40180 [Streptomyces decoyicus]|uniref:Uncharacterized protein n=1 Tax=Streptomyces decoyicus TaxID=249567 RepID=A0ABZ1FT55_9ACTN|nr:hypothetical protein [Streptomyces decoyicus]WSB73664.1 hypothetical protein OG863_40180 [Streptomyces decoyicus]
MGSRGFGCGLAQRERVGGHDRLVGQLAQAKPAMPLASFLRFRALEAALMFSTPGPMAAAIASDSSPPDITTYWQVVTLMPCTVGTAEAVRGATEVGS